MKKNLLTVLVLALCVVNLILNVLIVFTLVPQSKQVNALITQIASAVDLELNSDLSGTGTTVPIDQIATYSIEDNLTINLKTGEDGESHIAVLGVTISMNNQDEDYETYGDLSTNLDLIKSTIISVVESYTYEQMTSDIDEVRADILEHLQDMYGSKFIIDVTFYYKVLQ